ncbi:fumarate hydratase C-terminal domain-containing protein [Escherichia coli]
MLRSRHTRDLSPRHVTARACPVVWYFLLLLTVISKQIDRQGIWIEKLEHNPGKYILKTWGAGKAKRMHNLNRPMKEILAQLSQYPVSTRLSLNGTIISRRDIAHAKLKEQDG